MEKLQYTRRSFLKNISAGAAGYGLFPALAISGKGSLKGVGTGYVYDPNFAQFSINGGDVPQRVTWIHDRMAKSGVLGMVERVTPHAGPLEYIKEVHIDEHVAGIQSIEKESGFLYGKGEIAELAVAHVLGAVEAVCTGKLKNAFCNIRPPGHHALQGGFTLGYCCYGNVVIAAEFALKQNNIDKVLIIDWDFHQGNGTHSLICGNDNILFFETYSPLMYNTDCDDLFPIGPGDSVPLDSNRINVRMPSGSDNDAFIRVFEEKLAAAADNFHPDIILISCGFDLKYLDSHGSFAVTSKGISQLTKIIQNIADEHAQGRIVSMLEGGYNDVGYSLSCNDIGSQTFYGLSACAESHLKTLMTGEIQEESDFYLKPDKFICDQSSMFSPLQPSGRELIFIDGDVLNFKKSIKRIASVNIFSLDGILTANYRVSENTIPKMDLRDLVPVRGRYVVRVLFYDHDIWTGYWQWF